MPAKDWIKMFTKTPALEHQYIWTLKPFLDVKGANEQIGREDITRELELSMKRVHVVPVVYGPDEGTIDSKAPRNMNKALFEGSVEGPEGVVEMWEIPTTIGDKEGPTATLFGITEDPRQYADQLADQLKWYLGNPEKKREFGAEIKAALKGLSENRTGQDLAIATDVHARLSWIGGLPPGPVPIPGMTNQIRPRWYFKTSAMTDQDFIESGQNILEGVGYPNLEAAAFAAIKALAEKAGITPARRVRHREKVFKGPLDNYKEVVYTLPDFPETYAHIEGHYDVRNPVAWLRSNLRRMKDNVRAFFKRQGILYRGTSI
jgi:hypothetical protein